MVRLGVRSSIVAILEPVGGALNVVDSVGAFILLFQLQGHICGSHVLPDEDQISNLEGREEVDPSIM